MPRPKNAIPTKKVTPTITMAVHDRLVRLAKIGIYGSSPAEVARHLIVSGLDDLTKTGVLPNDRSEEHTSELQSLMRISYAVFCLKKKKKTKIQTTHVTVKS